MTESVRRFPSLRIPYRGQNADQPRERLGEAARSCVGPFGFAFDRLLQPGFLFGSLPRDHLGVQFEEFFQPLRVVLEAAAM